MSGKKTKTQRAITALYQDVQKPARFEGFTKDYHPTDDDGEPLPSDRKNISITTTEVLEKATVLWSDLFDLIATQDHGNCSASHAITVDDTVVLPAVPVSTLIFLEKRLEEVRTVIAALPVLSPEKTWEWSDDTNCFITPTPEQTRKTTKVRKATVLYPATDHHPAQVESFAVDETCGWWHTTHQSGAIQAKDKADKLVRIDKLIDAVKAAREAANEHKVTKQEIAKPLFEYILTGAKPAPNTE